MKLNCYSIELVSSIGTPMKADTLAGQLLCNYAEKYGQTKMEKLVEEIHNGKLPFTISDSFPEGQLPSPTLPPVSREELHDYFGGKGAYVLLNKPGSYFRTPILKDP